MIAYGLIRRKRDGESLSPDEIASFFRAYGEGRLPDYQMAAFLMAVCCRGLDATELAALVDVMVESGAVADLGAVPGRKVDKHSTGGVGDKVSLVLAPLAASLGVAVPMMAGRGLGHTGGTLDKLEAIPGFRTDLSLAQFRAQLERIGCAIIGQTDEIAPLDRRLYALRDVTATVESIPLIASSIMSKKLAEGMDALALDVKRGGGAFLPDLEAALALARTMIGIGEAYGRDVVALVTAMDRPLGSAVGNALEVEEAIEALRGGGPADLRDVVTALAAEMLVLGGAAGDVAEGREAAAAALADGRALARMERMIVAQGGDPAVLENPALLPRAPCVAVLEAETDGYVARVDARAIGGAAVALGAGRTTLGAPIDPAVGFRITTRPGQWVVRGAPLGAVYARTRAEGERALRALRAAIPLAEAPPPPPLPLISHRVTSRGVERWEAAAP
ncbi:MAG TPA: thymidine phosphorylase [Longimicrobiales bacterium]